MTSRKKKRNDNEQEDKRKQNLTGKNNFLCIQFCNSSIALVSHSLVLSFMQMSQFKKKRDILARFFYFGKFIRCVMNTYNLHPELVWKQKYRSNYTHIVSNTVSQEGECYRINFHQSLLP